MDFINRFVYILIVCLCLGHIANGNILDILKNVVFKLTGYDQTEVSRRFLNEPAATATAIWGSWQNNAACSATCGDGVTEFTRSCSTGNVHDCENTGGSYWEIAACNNHPCGAYWTEWKVTKTCSVTCGTGVQVRQRNCSTGVNKECTGGSYFEFQTCTRDPCFTTTQAPSTTPSTVPAAWSEWNKPGACSVTCDAGYKEFTRTCSTGNARDCRGQPWQVVSCTERSCIMDGIWEDWASWSTCSATCGPSQRSRSRSCTFPDPANKGKDCPGDTTETESCSTSLCPVDGSWEQWNTYSPCSASCGSGYKFRSRVCGYQQGVPHGNKCVGDDFDTNTCMNQECEVDGLWSEWSAWSTCSKTCGDDSIKFRNRFCKYEAGKPHGKACEGLDIGMENCQLGKCPVDGILSAWTSWTQCSHTCDTGVQGRTRVCTYDALAPKGRDCVGPLNENRACGQQFCPVDGTWGDWGSWAQCSETCGSASTTRVRTCEYKTLTAPHGKVCDGESFERKNCSDVACPVDGSWTTWTKFNECSVTCGTGLIYRTRQCIFDQFAAAGGNCSGVSMESRECHKQQCAVDGTLTEWTPWSSCTKSCENGTQHRSRDCFFPTGVPHGLDCVGAVTDTVPCNESPCPVTTTVMMTTTEAFVNGSWSEYGNWTDCSQTCGTGSQTRSRMCTSPDHTQHAQQCPGSPKDTRLCNKNMCPVDGQWATWTLFGRCSATCENGTYIRNRTCSYDAMAPHGQPCPGNDTDIAICNSGPCPVDGFWDAWGAWSNCPVTCGGSVQERVRICEYPGIPHGDACVGESHDNQTCGTEQCPVVGKLSEWTTWTDCPVLCGNGSHTRNRSCDFPDGARHDADCLGELSQVQPCNENLCPVDGVLTEWTAWEKCSQTCGGGTQQHSRICQYDQHAPHGKKCVGATSESQSCNTDKCPVNGIWGAWGAWSQCSESCEDGTYTRTRPCNFANGGPRGKYCEGAGNKTEACNEGPCPGDGSWSDWSTWTPCTASCGNGTTSRDRHCVFQDGVSHGLNCSGDTSEVLVCNTTLCPIDGYAGVWAEWTQCPVTCGGAQSTRQRSCVFDTIAPHGANCVEELSQSQNCSETPCPVDGVWTDWSPFTNCSQTCGNGTTFRRRKCEFSIDHPHGKNCSGDDTESASCNPDLCPVDGKFTVWSDWSDCSKSCENGTQDRSRQCEYDTVAPRGNDCVGNLTEIQPCNVEKCPFLSHWSNYTDFSSCSNSCGNGTYTRNRTCISHEPHPEAACFGPTNETAPCNEGPCPVDGKWSDWGNWSVCSAMCGGGQRSRGHICEYEAGKPKGANCTGVDHQVEACGTDLCPVDGTLTDWTPWTNCSVTCDDGVQFRNRKCNYQDGAPHGKDCNATLTETKTCPQSPCPVDGLWSDWSAWGTCDAQCGNGTMARNRTCGFKDGAPHGVDCVGLTIETASCNETPCPVNGTWSKWSEYSACTKSCGNGTATRSRTCEFAVGAPHGTNCSGDTAEVIRCNTTDCREDGVWTDWGTWSNCSVSCGPGNKTRSRTCTYPTSVHGDTCPGDATETGICNDTLCPVNGTWANWGSWSTCTATCGKGVWSRKRNCTFDAVAPHGADCPGPNGEQNECQLAECTVDGIWTDWNSWGVCSQTCENGTETRTRNCAFNPPTAPRGKNCSGDESESQVCTNAQDCPVDGFWLLWSPWSSCSVTCGSADKYRNRTCDFDSLKPHGNDCNGPANETVDCGLGLCPVDGVWGEWQAWAQCSITCGKDGTRNRIRTCNYATNAPRGNDCAGNGTISESCDAIDCPVSGFWEAWGRWHGCSVTCGGGTRTRSRHCAFPPHTVQTADNYCKGDSHDREDCSTQAC